VERRGELPPAVSALPGGHFPPTNRPAAIASITKVSALVRGRVEGYSLDRLFRFLNALGQRVEISVRPNANNTEACAVGEKGGRDKGVIQVYSTRE
jgi:hypothetical protein